MKACEECSRLWDKPLPPQSGCNECYELLRDDYSNLQDERKELVECILNFVSSVDEEFDGRTYGMIGINCKHTYENFLPLIEKLKGEMK